MGLVIGLFGIEGGVADPSGGPGIHQKRRGVLHNRVLINDIRGRRPMVVADPCAHVRTAGRPSKHAWTDGPSWGTCASLELSNKTPTWC